MIERSPEKFYSLALERQERIDFDKAGDNFIKSKGFLSTGAREPKNGFLS